MITLTSAAQAALTARVTAPIHLIEIGFEPVSRFSTYGDVSWNGESWSGARSVKVSGLSADGSAASRATVTLGNLDLILSALVLNQGVVDRYVRIWGGSAAALAAADPVLQFSGTISYPDISDTHVILNCTSAGVRTQLSPRRFIGPSAGFNTLIPAGTKIKFGTETYVLERS